MNILYQLSIRVYGVLIFVFSFFNKKAKLWVEGRRNIFERIAQKIGKNEQIAWFHTASLGEFEQGRPVIEEFRKQNPDFKILLTFFSPSGFEIRKNYNQADYIFYLPIDTKANAQQFINLINPKIVFFVKYEFWYNYLTLLKKRNIPVYLFSAIFRADQIFFKWYGSWYINVLQSFAHLFVQNETSKQLLETINIKNVTVAGDTRFDRVYSIVQQTKVIPIAEKFKQTATVFIAGSTWQPDEEIIIRFINETTENLKFIIAPHEIHNTNIQRIVETVKKPLIKYSEANDGNILDKTVLLIDNIGMLSSLYKYGEIAYIGGGFGVGIHNTLEAATFGLPVVFGTNYYKFQEAKDLIALKGAFSINHYDEFKPLIDKLINDKQSLETSGNAARNYVQSKIGATKIILDKIKS